ncbi:MAG: TPM domain-containing protein [archaeon]
MRRLLFFSFIILFALSVHAQIIPTPQGFVLDTADMLTLEQEQSLETRLAALEQTTSVEIAVYIFPSLEGGDMFLYTQSVFEQWKIGQKGKNNGLLITISAQDREWRIHTGYGLEGTLPDAWAYQIGTRKLVPYLKEGDYFSGISAALDDIEGFVLNDPSVQASYEEKPLFEGPFELFGLGFTMVLIAGVLLILTLIKATLSIKGSGKAVNVFSHFFFFIMMGIWITFLVGFFTTFLFNGFFGFTALSAFYAYLLLFGKFPMVSHGSSHSGSFIGGWGGGGFGGGGFGGGGFGGGSSGGGGAGGGF